MDNKATGALIAQLRRRTGLTQAQLAMRLCVTAKAVSKWETGAGLPDISLLPALGELLGVEPGRLLGGELPQNAVSSGSMRNSVICYCPACGNLLVVAQRADVSCCGRRLPPLRPVRAEAGERLGVELIDGERVLTAGLPMEKDDYIPFTVWLSPDRVAVFRHFSEWEYRLRLPAYGHGRLIWYRTGPGKAYEQPL